ncbi:MAG TPA: glycosyltransferase family 2 protein [Bryobacteraceae bacterium]|jgi:dolichol-phosphate mannosyltransferase|nr:glycosyltransferase family 2 protein [Bryobacteraceae bacterium]
MTALSVAIPCYNEKENLPELHRRVTAACRASVGESYQIVLVNDGSTDSTWETIRNLAADDHHILGANLSRNHGHQLALTAALSYCQGERVLILDADLQDPPELLPEMLRLMDSGAEIVYGQRRSRAGESLLKRTTAALFYRVLEKLSDVAIPRDTGDFQLISRRVLDVLRSMSERQRFIRGMIAWTGFSHVRMPYDRAPRFAGHTHYPFRRMVTLALDAVTSFSIRPLRVGLYLGAFLCALAVILIVLTLFWWIVFKPFPGWTSLMIVFLLIGGVQTILLGLIGEYLSRLYLEAKNRPLFVVSELINVEAGKQRGA